MRELQLAGAARIAGEAAAAAPGGTARLHAYWRLPAGRALLALVAVMLLVRLATLGLYPLMDTSEARYGEIARVMLETGNFVTPQEIAGTPFWAKPPLYAWLSAASMAAFGVNEFALRLPSLLCALGVLALCFSWAGAPIVAGGASSGAAAPVPPVLPLAPLLAVALLASSVLFFVAAGAVMTDPCLALCTTAMLAAFHRVVLAGSRGAAWRYGFFVAAGLGMLAKGPVIVLYAGAPIVLWTLWEGRLAQAWRALPWAAGTALAVCICAPWYWLAELRTPGFLRYFLLGEHVMRFLKPGWGGDLYGTAHAEPLGMIWLYLAGALGAGSLLAGAAVVLAVRDRLRAAPRAGRTGAHGRYLLLAALVPLVFFSFAGNIIWTYALPALGPLAVLVAQALAPRMEDARARTLVLGTLYVGAAVLAVAVLAWVPRHVNAHSSATLVARWREQAGNMPGAIVYVGRKAPASLRFYARGAVLAVPDLAGVLQDAGTAPGGRFLAVAPAQVPQAQAMAAAPAVAVSLETVGANADLALLWAHAGPARLP